MINPISYTSRSFLTILNDINSDADLVDKPDWFKRIVAGVGDVLAMYEDVIANQSFLRTAFTRQAVVDLLKQIDYELTPHITSVGTLLFYIKRDASFPVAVDKSELCGSTSGNIAISTLRFEARASVAISAFSETFTASAGTDELAVARTGGYYTGDLIRTSTTTTLPAPLQINTDYYVVRVSATKIKLAETLNEAFAGTVIDITDAGTGTHTATLFSFPATAYQQTTIPTVIIGTSDGTTLWQEFDLVDLFIIRDTVAITINGDSWIRVDTFIDSTSTDKHFRMLYKSDGASYVQFGNGTYGAIPGNFDVYADYAFGGGSISNVSSYNRVKLYSGGNSNITGVTNTTTMSGGADEESIESAKILGPILLKAQGRFVTVADGEALVMAYGGVSRVKITPNYYGPLSCMVVCVPTGGGVLDPSVKTAIDDYLTERSILDSVDVRVVDASYVAVNITAQIKMLSGYTYADYEDMIELAFRLLTSELTAEIVDKKNTLGIAAAVTFINSTWTYVFTSTDYPQIASLIDNVDIPNFGTNIEYSNVAAFIERVEGVDYLTITVPSTWPVTFGSDEIATNGTITLSEIV